ncbi:allantoinase: allantoinase [Rubrobacter radiotolerans]|uniref:Allantoinase n=1 Tax=Rubrobacter radiotolerans TaxID=42256 RepID=A0A023X341_RUBRA|nr:allantoinase AllB [Rubrobacter radiotolerans]AHY46591.1 allantoinase: allantoinase [Rubrobacter radiotolerans]MDX5893998.1 allantoinase AllB [Rubrobacter radiotolerans]SMC04945.1 allantoinase [Rubrobacter radiotolerans DSM 5868]
MRDAILRGGSLVTPQGVVESDLAVEDGRIAEVAPEIEGPAREEIDASGLHVFPGGIDAHAHFNEPGRTNWEGFESGSRALAAGGLTACLEMPLNAYPPTCDAESFDRKRELAESSSLVDFGLYGGLVPGNLKDLEPLAERGVAGFKAFMSTTGTLDYTVADDLTLYEGMAEAARLGLPVLVHAENKTITDGLAGRAVSTLRLSARDYLESRPVVAELEAINRAILLAEETGCSLHIVHVSTGRGVALVAEARARGVDVTCETCAHYLVFTDEDVERLGAVAKCAPPIRSAGERDALIENLLAGDIPFVTSDHSPCPPWMKAGDDFFRAWGGISGCQSLLNVVLDLGLERDLPLERISALVSGNVAERFGLAGKGRIEVGADADLALVNLDRSFTLRESDLFYKHRVSPYVGMRFRGEVAATVVRGRTVFREGKVVSEPVGRFVRPEVAGKEKRT